VSPLDSALLTLSDRIPQGAGRGGAERREATVMLYDYPSLRGSILLACAVVCRESCAEGAVCSPASGFMLCCSGYRTVRRGLAANLASDNSFDVIHNHNHRLHYLPVASVISRVGPRRHLSAADGLVLQG
jgi:hypothetical protein